RQRLASARDVDDAEPRRRHREPMARRDELVVWAAVTDGREHARDHIAIRPPEHSTDSAHVSNSKCKIQNANTTWQMQRAEHRCVIHRAAVSMPCLNFAF